MLNTNEQTLLDTLISIQNERSLTDSEQALFDSLEQKRDEPIKEPTQADSKSNSKWTPLTYEQMVELDKQDNLIFSKEYNKFVENTESDGSKEGYYQYINYATNLSLTQANLAKKAIETLKAKTIDTKPHLYTLLDKIQKEYFDNGIKGNIDANSLHSFKQTLIDSLPKGSSDKKLLEELSKNYKVGVAINEQNYRLYNHFMDNLVKSKFHGAVAACKLNTCTIITWLDAIELMVNLDLEVSSDMFDILTANYGRPISDISELLLEIDLKSLLEKIEFKSSNSILDLIKNILNN